MVYTHPLNLNLSLGALKRRKNIVDDSSDINSSNEKIPTVTVDNFVLKNRSASGIRYHTNKCDD